jgi:Protein of unknown function (DUF3667)
MNSPPVPVVSPPEAPLPETLVCANCHAPLVGDYCVACGQRHEPHVHTLSHFAGEAFESISHADSRLWRTLLYLFTRPGFLTREFFAGRRVSYLPPFRLYLVISVVFFLVAGVPKDQRILEIDTQTPAERAEAAKTLNDVAKKLEAQAAGNPVLGAVVQDLHKDAATAKAAADDEEYTGGVGDGVRDFCDEFRNQTDLANTTRKNLRDRCRKIAQDGGKELGVSIVHNLPRAMFVFLPLLALFMKLLYWKPKRYYVEHLLFLIHNHAFVFLTLTFLILFGRIPYIGAYVGWLVFANILYMIWYIFRGMRNYYGQGGGLTFAKYLTLALAYITTSLTVFLLTALYSAMTT